jgi:hypothetical protein
MKNRLVVGLAAVLLLGGVAIADNNDSAKVSKDPRTADGHPDLSGIWAYAIDLPPATLKKETNGKVVSTTDLDQRAARPAVGPVSGALPFTAAPNYKPEFRDKVKNLFDNESKTDEVFYCGKPGVPRIGPPRRIIQLPGEIVFFYEDISGDPYRIIPTDGRAHRKNANPSYYGDSVAHWQGDTLIVDVTDFLENGWFGEGGYFHTDAMHVTERLWRNGDNLVWQASVDDPNVLESPWIMPPRLIAPSNDPLQESPPCVEDDAHRLLNSDHHQQR